MPGAAADVACREDPFYCQLASRTRPSLPLQGAQPATKWAPPGSTRSVDIGLTWAAAAGGRWRRFGGARRHVGLEERICQTEAAKLKKCIFRLMPNRDGQTAPIAPKSHQHNRNEVI